MSCPDCFTGTVHAGTPSGRITSLHGLQTYVTEPAGVPDDEIKGIVIIIPDAFGWEFVNNRLLADKYAESGKFRVYLPDFMKGTAVPAWGLDTIRAVMKTGSLWDWISKPYHIASALYVFPTFLIANRPTKSYPIVESFFTSVRQSPEGQKHPIGAAGFCWGGKHTILLAHGASTTITPIDNGSKVKRTLIDAGFTGHPSLLSLPGDIEKITIPVSFALGDLDSNLKGEKIELIKNIVHEKEEVGGEVRVYVGAGHGFCVRADTAVEQSDRQAAEAEEQAVEFFRKRFAKI
ncbi:dienelactone hydrolase [Aspergillus nidulans var. acristatus]